MKERIAKKLSQWGICSRREAEAFISKGLVTVNDTVITAPNTFVDETDLISLNGKKISSQADTPKLWIYNKPKGLIVSRKDEKDRETVFDALSDKLPRVVSIGRLDLTSEGLLLVTNTPSLAHNLEKPHNGLLRIYKVRAFGIDIDTLIKRTSGPLTIDGTKYKPIKITAVKIKEKEGTPAPSREKRGPQNHWLQITLTEGKNREIRKILNHFDFQVSRLIRTDYGPFSLGKLRTGELAEVDQKLFEKFL